EKDKPSENKLAKQDKQNVKQNKSGFIANENQKVKIAASAACPSSEAHPPSMAHTPNPSQSAIDSDQESETTRSWSMTVPSTSMQYDPTWSKRIHEYVASTQLRTTNAMDDDFNENLRRCAEAMEAGVHPLRIPSGSSGSYFIRDANEETIAVFKPKNEEPFAPLNPKWPKFFQRILCFCCFGRACLIPNNGYLSETGASLVDEKFELHIVPKTRIVKLASPAFFYTRNCWQTRAPKLKDGSYQLFVHGYVSANSIVPEWSKEGRPCPLTHKEAERFKLLFQKMCVLDYVIRNTDRHMDNWLIRYQKDDILEIAAIDNGLAFPVKHPETASRLRPFPFGWAHLSWAKMPWNAELRSHLLHLLTPCFVQELCDDIKMLFKYDKEVNRFLKYNQLRVMRGQIWNLRMALLANEPPSEMVKRPLLLVSRRHHNRPLSDNWNESFRVKRADYTARGCC
ncbi:Phosphatidylinositol 4-kinase type 2-beta, partial [Toxocara canis]